MAGIVYALISVLFWGANGVLIRLGVRETDPLAATFVSLLPGIPIMGFTSLALENYGFLHSPPWLALGLYAASGVLAFTLARTGFFLSVHVIGAARSSVFLASRVVIAPLLGIVLLHEAVPPRVAVGVLIMFVGFVVLLREPAHDAARQRPATK